MGDEISLNGYEFENAVGSEVNHTAKMCKDITFLL